MTITINGTTGIAGVDGSAANPAVQGADTNTGVFYGTDIVAISTGGTERVRVDASGNVGIGATPGTILDVYKASGNPYLRVYSGTGSVQAYVQAIDSTYVVMGSLSNHALGLVTNGTERMRLDTSGNLLVGCTSQANAARATWQTATNNARYIGFQTTAGAEIGFIFNNTTATQYSTTSDYRLKKDIVPMTGALAKVQALKPVTYKWKSNDSDAEGFIAHELAEVCPSAVVGTKDAVNENGDPNYQGIDTSFLVATLTAAIQEQQAMIIALTARITALEATP